MLSDSPSNSIVQRKYGVLICTSFYEPAFLGGGPIQTLKALIASAPPEFHSQLVCLNHDLGDSSPLVNRPNEWLQKDGARVFYVHGGLLQLLQAYRSLENINIVYLNSLFNPRFSLFPLILHRLGLWRKSTLLMAPRGELYPGALAQKSWKKKLFIRALRMLRLPDSVVWHASTDEEATQIRSVFGKHSRIMIREDETSLPKEAYARPYRPAGPLRLLFVSRVHPQKGLHILLKSLEFVTEPVELEIIGAFVDDAYEETCRAAAKRLPKHVALNFRGPLPHEEVLQRMRESDFLALPTAGENFGHVIAEALSASCPVLCSNNTPWSDFLSAGGGMVVSSNTSDIWAETLTALLERGPQDWEYSAQEACRSYNEWRNESKGQHIFNQVIAEVGL